MNRDACPTTSGLLLVISGPSGVGKTTITHEVERRLGGEFSVSVTTRPRTSVDIEGRDYYFIDEAEFKRLRDAGDLLEWAQVFGKYHYGTPRKIVEQKLAQGNMVILEIDVQGGFQIKEKCPASFMIFVLPPSDEELLRRLRNRAREGEDSIQRRFAEAKQEIKMARESGAYDAFIVNDDLQTAVQEAIELVQRRQARNSDGRNLHSQQK